MAVSRTTPSSNRVAIAGFTDFQTVETVDSTIGDYGHYAGFNIFIGYRNLPVRPPGDGWRIVERRDRSTVWSRMVTVPDFSIDIGAA
jgi:hypothetical protein